jgi:transcriptional regulator with XRE-family HTH domain
LNFYDFTDETISSLHTTIANNIKIIRKSKNVTQLELALAIGHKSMSTIAKIEAGIENKHYNVEQLYKISKVLDVPICEFFKNVDELKNKQ